MLQPRCTIVRMLYRQCMRVPCWTDSKDNAILNSCEHHTRPLLSLSQCVVVTSLPNVSEITLILPLTTYYRGIVPSCCDRSFFGITSLPIYGPYHYTSTLPSLLEDEQQPRRETRLKSCQRPSRSALFFLTLVGRIRHFFSLP